MILKKILLAFCPPGIGLVYHENNKDIIKHIDLTNLNENSDTHELTNKILQNESIEIQSYRNIIHNGILKIQEKLIKKNSFIECQKSLVHFLPVTNIAIDNSGEKCVTGSYDQTARIWNLETSEHLHSLEGHGNVVFSVAFSSKGDKILTGSFDKTAKLWDTATGNLLQTYQGHTDELVSAQFLPQEETAVTASTDTSLRIFHLETAQEIRNCIGHTKDIVCVQIGKDGKFIASGSFDKTIRIWDARNGSCIHVLCGHDAEISSCKINDEGTMLVSGSFDGRIIVWDLRKMKYCKILPTHPAESQKILDVDFKSNQVAGCSAEGNAFIFNLSADQSLELRGHEDTISKVCFNPMAEHEVVTCSTDHTVRVWDLQGMEGTQVRSLVLEHPDEVFSVTYSQCGNKIISACKDNACRIWENFKHYTSPSSQSYSGQKSQF